MPPVDSRLGPGTLTIGTTMTSAGCQASNVKLVPEYDEEDGTPTLCEPQPPPLLTEAWKLTGTSIQDWEDDAGFVEFCRLNAMTEQTFSWVPNTSYDPVVTYSGTVQIRAIEFGGDVSKQNTSDWEFSLSGVPTRTSVPVVP